MLFNSIEFAVFLVVVFTLYWSLASGSVKLQNSITVVSSYVFYAWWDWRFLSLIVFATAVGFFFGLSITNSENQSRRKLLLRLSILFTLGLLAFFKYYNFFVDSFLVAFGLFDSTKSHSSLHIILPLGISFYTFQTLSYTIDVYYRRIEGTRNLMAFAAYLSFFPQLVAGPIERATTLLPQFFQRRQFSVRGAEDGLSQMVWGFFKKIVIADNCARFVDPVFNNYQVHSGSTLVVAAIMFAFQIYADFSGYSDIAIGTARLFGVNLTRNFSYPYFSRSVAEFWRRWHISLSTWIRDYVYIPLGGNRGTRARTITNTFLVFAVTGLWHGAGWTFIVWGLLHAIFLLPGLMIGERGSDIFKVNQRLTKLKDVLSIVRTFTVVTFAWIVFRSASLVDATLYIRRIFSASFFTDPNVPAADFVMILLIFLSIEALSIKKLHPLQLKVNSTPSGVFALMRPVAITLIVWCILLWGAFDSREFIYFQF